MPATRVLRWSLGCGIDIAIAHSARMKVCQAFAYAKTLNLRRFGLVRQADGEVMPTTHRIRDDDVSVLVRTVPVGTDAAGLVGLDLRAAQVARDLIRELDGALAGRRAA